MKSDAVVISASRRSDIPAFFMPWFMECIAKGEFEVVNPYNRTVKRIPATAPPVHTIVFWSKNFGPFLAAGWGDRLRQLGYHLYFQFTINSDDPVLEPNLPGLGQRLEQLQRMCDRFGPQVVSWRLDPICHYRWNDASVRDNLADVERIAAAAAAAGIRRCTTSFMDVYAKVARRAARHPGFQFVESDRSQRVKILLDLELVLSALDIALFTCCENETLAALPDHSKIAAAACIPNDLLMRLYGGHLSLGHDSGQRRAAGCGCRISSDIGSYDRHRCRHGCLYCYANPGS
ncbi:MAG: DUF1848 domain-containing protein [Desulfobacterales bacterium]|jgi:hypothetical protein|nr:DUF1848 domain-containing protein [Desulfobacterales bacterium]